MMNDSEGQLNGNDLAKHVKTSLSLKTLGRNLGLMGSDECFMQKGLMHVLVCLYKSTDKLPRETDSKVTGFRFVTVEISY
jgi:hypothetical protein